jgi:transposase
MDERLRFIGRLLEGKSMSELCREAGIFRKTGYKIFSRYKEEGVTALSDRSCRPYRYANQLPPQQEAMITGLKKDKPHLCSSWTGLRSDTLSGHPLSKTCCEGTMK